jgi:hypothetical protein
MAVSQAVANPAEERRAVLIAGLVIVVGAIATTLPQVVVLAYIPLQNLLKNALHADRSANAAFFFWTTMPWNLKPLVGLCEDTVPIFGSRRKSYLIIGGALAALGWFALSLMPIRYAPLLTICVVISSAMVIASTAIGGYMVEAAKASASSGRLTSLRNFSMQFSVLVAGPASGLLGSLAIVWTAISCGSIAFLIVPVALWCLRERRQPSAPGRIMQEARAQFRSIGRAGTMWAVAGIATVFYMAPGVFTALFYIQQNDLHMDTEAQGFLQLLNGAFGMLAALLYGGVLCRRFTLRTLLMVCMVLGAIGNLSYWFYASPTQARIAESLWGFGFTIADVAMMHVMVRATPAGSEALGFSLLMSVRNFCLYGSNWAGSFFIDHFHLKFHVLVLLNGGTSLLAVPLVLLLPKAITMVRDGLKGAQDSGHIPPPGHALQG